MPFIVGNVVRPKLTRRHVNQSTELQDFAGKVSGQGRVMAVLAAASTPSANYWNPFTSSNVSDASAVETLYTVRAWNSATLAFEDATYPESELDAGAVGASLITTLVLDPLTDFGAANLCGTRIV